MDPLDVRAWKLAHGAVYSLAFREEEFAFRALTYREFDELRLGDHESSADLEEEMVARALLYPEALSDRTPPGVVSSLAEEILEISGFGSPARMKAVMEDKRLQAGADLRILMKAFVLSTMPSYTEEDLDDLNFERLAGRVALAEQIIRLQQSSVGIEHDIRLEIIDPVEEAEQARQDAARRDMVRKPGQAGAHDPIAARLHSALG